MITMISLKRTLRCVASHTPSFENISRCVIKNMCINKRRNRKLCLLSPCSSQVLISPYAFPKMHVHTTKGWKIIARTGQKPVNKLDADGAPTACEEGKGAIPHSVLISQLQSCNSISDQIDLFCSLMSVTPEEIEIRENFRESLVNIFKIYFPHFKIHLFGSSVNGLGFKGSDVDLSIQTIFDDKEYVHLTDVPTLDSVVEGLVPPETVAHMTPLYLLRFVRRIFREHCPDIKEPILLIKARCPILRFYNAKYEVYCDFSCENQFSLRNTKLLRLISHLDGRFASLAKIIRYWGKYGGFVGDIDRFNSYAFSLLVIYFLQNTSPPMLPPITEMISKSDYLMHGAVDDHELFYQDLIKFEPSKNTQTVEELLREYYFYYLNFDFSRVMQPLTNSSVPKENFVPIEDSNGIFEFSTVAVQDPFRTCFNATGGAVYKMCRKFLCGLIQACKVYQDKSLWVPNTEMWGICSLFNPLVSELEMQKAWQKDNFHEINLPFKLDAAKNLKNIFQYGLLLECIELKIHDLPTNNNTKQFLRMMCKAYHNTWQGRNWASKKFCHATSNALELEHMISTELQQSKTESRRVVLCEFLCECYEINRSNEFVINLTFQESKFPLIVAIFLKEYIPYIYGKV